MEPQVRRAKLEIPAATAVRHAEPSAFKDSPSMMESPMPMEGSAIEETPLRIFVFDTQRTCSKLFTKQFCAHLRFGTISHPFALAATVGPERINKKLRNNDRATEVLEKQVAAAPPRIATLTYHAALYRFLKDADKLETEVCMDSIFAGGTLSSLLHTIAVHKTEGVLTIKRRARSCS